MGWFRSVSWNSRNLRLQTLVSGRAERDSNHLVLMLITVSSTYNYDTTHHLSSRHRINQNSGWQRDE